MLGSGRNEFLDVRADEGDRFVEARLSGRQLIFGPGYGMLTFDVLR